MKLDNVKLKKIKGDASFRTFYRKKNAKKNSIIVFSKKGGDFCFSLVSKDAEGLNLKSYKTYDGFVSGELTFENCKPEAIIQEKDALNNLEEVMKDDRQILLSSQIDPSVDEPQQDGIYKVGVLANVLQLLKLPDGTVKVLVEGKTRVKIISFIENNHFFEARASEIRELSGDETATKVLLRSVAEEFSR